MSNHHFKERGMSLKAKGLLSLMLSLPDSWEYNISGLVTLSKDGKDSVMSALAELEEFKYLKRTRLTNEKGQFTGIQYDIFEEPQPENPISDSPTSAMENSEKPISEKREQLNTNSINNESNELLNESNKDKQEMDDILMSLGNVDLIELYWEYIDVRKDLGSPLNARSLKRLVARNERLSKNNIKIQKLLLENAILNNWKNIYLPTEAELQNTNQEIADEFKNYLGLE
jgi:hypothetical protein